MAQGGGGGVTGATMTTCGTLSGVAMLPPPRQLPLSLQHVFGSAGVAGSVLAGPQLSQPGTSPPALGRFSQRGSLGKAGGPEWEGGRAAPWAGWPGEGGGVRILTLVPHLAIPNPDCSDLQ